jgi:glycerophosphoryl diester phosphodiesterase
MGTGKKIFALALGTTAAWAYAIKPRTKDKPDLTLFSTYDYANGGCHDFGHNKPDNSIEAYEEALRHGYGIVMDVRITKDGVPVTFSDHELWRMCSMDGKVELTKYEKLKNYKLLETEQGIPSLEEALDVVDGQVPVLLNIHSWKENHGFLCTRICEVLDKYEGIVAIESLDYRVVRWFKNYRPNVIRGQMLEKRSMGGFEVMSTAGQFAREWLLTNWLTKPDFISCHLADRDGISLRFCKLLYHVPLIYWTICTTQEYEIAREDDAVVVFEDIEP